MSGLNARLFPTPLPLLDPFQSSPAGLRTEALQRTSPFMRESLIATGPVAAVLKKSCLGLPSRPPQLPLALVLPAADPLPIALALAVSFLSARRCRPVTLLRLVPSPFSRRFPAARAAIPLACLPGVKALLAAFQQTTPHPRPAGETLTPRHTSDLQSAYLFFIVEHMSREAPWKL